MFSAVVPKYCKVHSSSSPTTIIAIVNLVINGILGGVVGTLIFHAVAILFGAPFVQDWDRTLLWSALMSSLAIVPASCIIGTQWDGWLHFLSLPLDNASGWNAPSIYYYCPSVGCILGAWLGAFPIPLDWDRPWQVWPISCSYGCILGYLAGLVVSLLGATLQHYRHPKRKQI